MGGGWEISANPEHATIASVTRERMEPEWHG